MSVSCGLVYNWRSITLFFFLQFLTVGNEMLIPEASFLTAVLQSWISVFRPRPELPLNFHGRYNFGTHFCTAFSVQCSAGPPRF